MMAGRTSPQMLRARKLLRKKNEEGRYPSRYEVAKIVGLTYGALHKDKVCTQIMQERENDEAKN